MKGKEKTVLGRRSNQWLETNKFNSNPGSDKLNGQKLQVSIRLESETIDLLKEIAEDHNISFSETTRRLIRTSLSQSGVEQQGGSIER